MHQEVKILELTWDKNKKYNFFLLFSICLVSIYLYSGCAASSNSSRYNKNEPKEKNTKSNIRFTSDDPDIAPAGNTPVDIDRLITKIKTPTNRSSGNVKSKEVMLMEIIRYMNTPYKFGGNSKKGIDCSAFTQTMFRNAISVRLNRTARDQYKEGKDIDEKKELKFGDLVFFDTRRTVKPGHVGIYLGDNLFAHASSSKGVTISSITSSYYSGRYMGGRRISKF